MDHRVTSHIYHVSAGAGYRGNDAPALLDALITSAVALRASDIHIQPTQQAAVVRLRINGVLGTHEVFSHQQVLAVISRLKVLCDLELTSQRVAQDGGLRVRVADALYDIRVSIFPTLYGQKVVMRLLDQGHATQQLATLALPAGMASQLHDVTTHQQGFFVATGPTGAGKSTTLYAMLRAVDTQRRNVVTLEDPVEYRIDGVTQTPINAGIGFTFAAAMRCLLRQDPDVALIGEMRDQHTARSAIEAALTGHLVLSSLHTTHACAVPIRLREMGVPAYLIASSLTGVLAQRLLPVRCTACKAGGCAQCRHTGVQGRVVVAELWLIDAAARELIADEQVSVAQLQTCAVAAGMVPMREVGQRLVEQGVVDASAIRGL